MKDKGVLKCSCLISVKFFSQENIKNGKVDEIKNIFINHFAKARFDDKLKKHEPLINKELFESQFKD